MKLIIDNSHDGRTVFFLKEKNVWTMEEIKGNKTLLAGLESVLKKYNKNITDITGIAVVVGLGRFTAERIAATVANTLALALNIPVVALPQASTQAADEMFLSARRGVYISAKYSGEAHIGGKNK